MKHELSKERLHQISEILSKASAQSDGGNLGYAMADAVKVIDEVLERRQADNTPVHPTIADEKLDDETLQELIEFRHSTFEYHSKEGHKVQTIIHGVVLSALLELQERRAAMLQAGNSPVTPDGWIPVSERMPNDKDFVWCWGYFSGWTESDGFEAYYDATRNKWWTIDDETVRKVTHWMPLPAAPKKEDL